ncbi:hypothetical protein [Hydrogenoanaerobacterium sp.]|uniref:hypothetical protein n=1 Tax=Hydrogenoanaerobacterium sp. TaxID=2953763 RepID=UPI00289B02B5|nr:hypothetical protein [Hydrogenoanaerobacterium sp.]
MMNKYSLCIAEIDYNTHEVRNKVNRIADFDIEDNCFFCAEYSGWEEKDIDNYYPRHVRAFASTLKPYVAEVRRWRTVSGTNIHTGLPYINTESESAKQQPIEVIFLSEIDLDKHNSDNEIRTLLQNGIEIPFYTSEDFLIVINKSSDMYESISFSKRNFQSIPNTNTYKIQKHCADMLKTTHYVGLFNIYQDDIVDTSACDIFNAEGQRMPIRYFFKYLQLGRAERNFPLRTPEDYSKAYISKYIKNNKEILKVSKSDAQKWITMIEEAFSNSKEITAFFENTGFKMSDIEYSLRHVSSEVKDFYLKLDDFSNIVSAALSNDPDVMAICREEIKNQWLAEQDDFKNEIISQMNSLKKDLSELENNKVRLDQMIAEHNAKKERLETTCEELCLKNKELEENAESIAAKTTEQLKRFQSDMVELATLSGLSNVNNSTTGTPYIAEPKLKLKMSESEIDDISCFVDDLQDNLIAYGLQNDYSYDFALFITATISLGKNIIVCGSKSMAVGCAISLLIEGGQAPVEIQFPMGWNDVDKTIGLINKSNRRTFVIHGSLDTVNTSMISSISKYCPEKIVLFSCEDSDVLNLIPRYLSNYVTFIATDSVWGTESESEDDLGFGNFNIDYLNIKVEKSQFEIVKNLMDIKPIRAQYQNNVTMIMSAYQQIGGKSIASTFANLFNLLMCCYTNKQEILESLSKCGIKEEIIALLEEEIDYE